MLYIFDNLKYFANIFGKIVGFLKETLIFVQHMT